MYKLVGGIKCSEGMILRKGFKRPSFTKKNGTHVNSVKVKPGCIKDRSYPGRREWRKETIKKINKSKSIAKKKFGNIKCKKGQLMREGYVRGSYTKKNGTHIQRKVMAPACIIKRGNPKKYVPPKGKTGIGPLKKGELSKFGYYKVKDMKVKDRKSSLKLAVKEFGAMMLVKKLGALRTYLKNTSPDSSQIYYQDQKWIRKTYDDQFIGDWKTSALFK